MRPQRQPRRKAGAGSLGRDRGTEQKAPARILTHLRHFRHAICRKVCPDMLFNSDMSREIDRLVDETDRLRERVRELEGIQP